MQQYNTFSFDSYTFDPTDDRIALHYGLDDSVKFTETLLLPKDGMVHPNADALEKALHTLHLFGGASYYKTCCPLTIDVRTAPLTADQAAFWNSVYTQGLGEFFYRNQIDFRGMISFPAGANQQKDAEQSASKEIKRVLVPIGGGKDSIVTAELLKKAGFEVTLFRMGKHPIITEAAKLTGLPMLTVDRHLSGTLFDLNADGALNGHVPITGYLSALTVLIALLYGFDAVAFSNEQSANEGNVEYLGMQVNHQWSKSLEFEQMFQQYLQGYVTADVQYCSVLRPWSELKIAEVFSTYPQYLAVTTSCNTNWRVLKERPKDRWCGTCPKCAFVFAILAAWLPADTLSDAFGKNLFADESLLPLYKELLGIEGFKPFECVGTPQETQAAFLIAKKRDAAYADTPAMQLFDQEVLPTIKKPDELIEEVLHASDNHSVPTPLLNALA